MESKCGLAMTHFGMSKGLDGSFGSIIAIRAIRHMWSEILPPNVSFSECSAQSADLSACLTPSLIHPERFFTCAGVKTGALHQVRAHLQLFKEVKKCQGI